MLSIFRLVDDTLKYSKLDQIGSKLDQNGSKWIKQDQSGPKWTKMYQIQPNGSNWIKLDQLMDDTPKSLTYTYVRGN